MAEKKQQVSKAPKATAATQKADAEQKKALNTKRNVLLVVIGVIILVAIVIAVLLQSGPLQSTVPFSTFKTNLDSAHNISILVSYSNLTQFNIEEPCFTYIVEVLSNKRNPNTINFYEVNATSCTYSPNGLGHQVTPQNTTASNCINQAGSVPGIVLSFSGTNSTTINAQRMQVYGNAAYYAQCPIAVDLN